jgi:hypothetical protein
MNYDFTISYESDHFLVESDFVFYQGFDETTFMLTHDGIEIAPNSYLIEIVSDRAVKIIPNLQIVSDLRLDATLIFKGGVVVKNNFVKSILEPVSVPTLPVEEEQEVTEQIAEAFKVELYERASKVFIQRKETETAVEGNFYYEKFFEEAYPDFPFFESAETKFSLEPGESKKQILSIEKGFVYKFFIQIDDDVKVVDIKARPMFYFSNVQSVLKDASEFSLTINKDEEYLKELIGEKSKLIKKAFGITGEILTDAEIYASLKHLTNLYVLRDLSSLTFVQDAYVMPSTEEDSDFSPNSNLKLGKFQVEDTNTYNSTSNGNTTRVTDNRSTSTKALFIIDVFDNMITKSSLMLEKSIGCKVTVLHKRGDRVDVSQYQSKKSF